MSVSGAAGAWGLRARASFAFCSLSSLGVEPFGTTEQGQSPPEALGRWRPLKAKGCVTSPLAAEAQARLSQEDAEAWPVRS